MSEESGNVIMKKTNFILQSVFVTFALVFLAGCASNSSQSTSLPYQPPVEQQIEPAPLTAPAPVRRVAPPPAPSPSPAPQSQPRPHVKDFEDIFI